MSEAGVDVRVTGLEKSFEGGRIRALAGVDLSIEAGEFVAVMGPSGCGKSTLLHMVGGLDVPDSGTIRVGGVDLGKGDLTSYRARTVGFVFQLHHLIPVLTVEENVEVPMLSAGGPPPSDRRRRARDLVREVGLEKRLRARPTELSGGERQRVAVARALANRPGLLLADEPTGSLDRTTGFRVLDLLSRLNRERGTTLVLVSHDPAVAARADRTIEMLDGRVLPGGSEELPQPSDGSGTDRVDGCERSLPSQPNETMGGPHATDP